MEDSSQDTAQKQTSKIKLFFKGLRAQHQRDFFLLTVFSAGLFVAAGITHAMGLGLSLFLASLILGAGLVMSRLTSTRTDQAVNTTDVEVDDETKPDPLKLARTIIDAFPDAVILLDEKKRILASNKTAQDDFVSDVVRGKVIGTVIRKPPLIEAIDDAMSHQQLREVEFTDPVPVERSHLASICPLADRDGGGIACVLMIRDLTAIKRSERMRADFVANASHELRTPLSSLAGFIETLKGHARDDPDAQDRFLQIMHEQAGRMRRLIDDLLSLSRIELNEHVAPSDKIDLSNVVSDVVDAAAPLADTIGAKIDVDAKDSAHVVGQRDELIQVIQNLVDNALKYGGDGGRIELEFGAGCPDDVHVTTEGPTSYIRVRDFGHGIPREHIPRLTERFYRIDVKHSRESGGTGLGLAIVKHIVSRHRGRLHIKSEENQGSCFTVVLPAPTDLVEQEVRGKVIPFERAAN